MAKRLSNTYRAHRRNAWRKAHRIWREFRRVSDVGGLRYHSHASYSQITPSSRPIPVPTVHVRSGKFDGDSLRIIRADRGVGRPSRAT